MNGSNFIKSTKLSALHSVQTFNQPSQVACLERHGFASGSRAGSSAKGLAIARDNVCVCVCVCVCVRVCVCVCVFTGG